MNYNRSGDLKYIYHLLLTKKAINMNNILKKLALTTSLTLLASNPVFADTVTTKKAMIEKTTPLTSEKVVVKKTIVEQDAERKYIASDFDIKINGFAHFQAGSRSQNHLEKTEKKVSNNRKSFAFYNSTALSLDAWRDHNEMTYGTKIVLVPTAKRKNGLDYNGSHIFVANDDFGRLELGSPFSAASNMFCDATVISAGTGDDWSLYADFATDYLKQSDQVKNITIDKVTYNDSDLAPSFITYSEFFLDTKLATQKEKSVFSSEPARGLTFYTPKFALSNSTNLQVGITYVPDSSNTGADSPTSSSSGENKYYLDKAKSEYFIIDSSVKDSISGGVALEQNLGDGVDLKLSATGEHGSSAGKAVRHSKQNTDLNEKEFKLSNLKTYNVGAILNMGNFSIAGSYGSLGKSLTTPEFHRTSRKTTYHTGGVAYKMGSFGTSLVYFKSNQYKNTVDSLTFSTDYKVAPGLKPYFEVSSFKLSGKPVFFKELKARKTKGTIVLFGLKLTI